MNHRTITETQQDSSPDFIEKLLLSIDSLRREPLTPNERYTIVSSLKNFLNEQNTDLNNCGLIEKFEALNSYLNSGLSDTSSSLGICLFLAQYFASFKDNLTTCHFINFAKDLIEQSANTHNYVYNKLVKLALNIGQTDLAVDLFIKASIGESVFNVGDRLKLIRTYHAIRTMSMQEQMHGHDLLLSYLKLQSAASLQGKLVVEIGTTRENAPGQGSTRLLAEQCKKQGLEFITVDMDPNNTLCAKNLFKQLDINFSAVTMKGELYLSTYQGQIDFIFLDAYDFDHGMHSELRQERYVKYLGSEIDEKLCHQMHLDCAEALIAKLSPDGIICFDDTWQNEEGAWLAKGTMAVPYLLSNGFEIIEARNKAILMRRKAAN